MRLLHIHVESFGILSGLDLDLHEGLNVLHRQNGWGKSTLAVFIKAMFYGLPVSTRRSLDENERKKYTPWQGGAYGGSLEFEVAEGKFRIERFFGAKEANDTFALFDLTTNKPSTAYSAAIGEELFGIDADGFERSTYLSQRLIADGKDNSSIAARLGNLLDDVDDIASFDEAFEALDKRRRYYVMTGNRGAIAELERACLEKQAELERCLRIREAMQAQQTRRDGIAAELQSVRARIEEVRSALAEASRAREHAALLEQRARMSAELDELSKQQKTLADRFGGRVPTEDELSRARALYEEIRADSVRLETLSAPSADTRALAQLREEYPSGLPSEELLAEAEEGLEELRRVDARRDALIASQDGDTLAKEFPSGVPTEERLNAAAQSLENAKKLRRSVEGFADAEPRRSPLLPIAWVLMPLGLLITLLSLLPALQALLLPLLAVGGVCVTVGVLLLGLGLSARAKERRRTEQLAVKCREWQARIEREEQSVRELLTSYRMPIRDSDLSRALAGLSMLAAQYRAGQQARRRVANEIASLNERRTEMVATLQRFLRAYLIPPTDTGAYPAAIHSLRQSAARVARLEESEQQRTNEIASLRAALNRKKQTLLPFLHRFDPDETLRAGACLDQIAENRTMHGRIGEQISEKQRALTAFVAEKHLDDLPADVDTSAYERLSEEDRQLHEQAEALGRQYTVLGSEIDRLSVDADRVPELSEEQVRLKGRIDEAKANAATVANTQKFLEEAKTALSTRYLDGMQESFRRYFTALTGADAPESLMDTSFEVRLREGGQTRTMESFSRGWRDAVRFCVRLSLADALFAEGERPFLLLDDPFVNLDNDRLAAARTLLEQLADEQQILYLVCHSDRI